MSGWLPLSATELKAWEAMTGNIVRREEWQIIRDMDGAFLTATSPKENGAVRSSSVEMTAGAFDALFA